MAIQMAGDEPAIDKWQDYINSLIWEKGSLDESSWNAFLRGASLGVDPNSALQEVAQRIQGTGDQPKASKLTQQLKRAYAYVQSSKVGQITLLKQPKVKPQYKPDALEKHAAYLGFNATPEWLEQISPIVPWNKSPAYILQQLFPPGDKVLIFTEYQSQGCQIWNYGDPFDSLDHLKIGSENGVWFMSNPIDGEWHAPGRLTGKSRRSEDSITDFRYAVLESDKAPKQLWLNSLVQIPLPIAAITDSGGRSIHALVRIDAADKKEWDELVRRQLLPIVTTLGADPQALTAVRLTRLPNCMRGSNQQRLLYLNPEPNLQHPPPISDMEFREPCENVWLRWANALIYWHGHEGIEGVDQKSALACLDGLLAFRGQPGVMQALRELRRLYVG